MKSRAFLVFIIVFLSHSIFSNPSNIIIENFNEKYGLPKNTTNCMCVFQDSKGFLWFGMANGLYKFDLNKFQYYSPGKVKESGFPESDVRAIIEYHPGILLIGTFNKGLLIYNTILERYDSIKIISSSRPSINKVKTLYIDGEANIWVGAFDGLYCLRHSKKAVNSFEVTEIINNKNSSLGSSEIVQIKEDSLKRLLILTLSEFALYNPINKSLKVFPTYGANSAFTFIDKSRIVIGRFGNGLVTFNTESLTFENSKIRTIDENANIRYILKDRSGNLWVSVSNVGLLFFEDDFLVSKPRLISNNLNEFSCLNSNVIYQIVETNDGAIWTCSEEGANMICLKPNKFNAVTIKNYSNSQANGQKIGVRTLLNSGENFIWTGTVGGGLKQFHYDSGLITDIPLYSHNIQIGKNIQAIIHDSKGNLWIGTEGDGVIKIPGTPRNKYNFSNISNFRLFAHRFPEKTLLNDFIMCMLEDKDNNIWIGTWHGLSLIEKTELEKNDDSKIIMKNFINDPGNPASISDNTIMSLNQDCFGNIWIATQEGINKIVKTKNGYEFIHDYKYVDGTLLTEKKVLGLFSGKSSKLWFSTQDGGIAYLDIQSKIIKGFPVSFLQDYIVNSFLEDTSGNLWLGTNNGLCMLNINTNSITHFTTEDGLISDNLLFSSNCRLNNTLYFGTNNGIIYFDPRNIRKNAVKPSLVFTDIKLFNKAVHINTKGSPLKKHISCLENLTLDYNQNFVTFEFAALNYSRQENINYSCMLEGLETSWNSLVREHRITYNNLLPGNYTFRVKAYNTNNLKSTSEIILKVTIKPPFWRTWLAYLIYLIIIALIILKIYKNILKKEREKNSIEIERLNARKTHEIDLLRINFFTKISHEFRTPLTLISSPLESLIKENHPQDRVREYYQLMQKNINRLTRIIDQLLDLRKIEEGFLKPEWTQGDIIDFISKTQASFQNYAEKRNIYYTFQSGPKEVLTFFDSEKLDKILFNIISNAFKYTPDYGTISIKIEKTDPADIQNQVGLTYINIKVSDSGCGIPKELIGTLFTPFRQIDCNKPIGSASSGIGLSLTKELIDMHKGYIEVNSEVNAGSTFSIYLPVYTFHPAKKQDVQVSSENEINVEEEKAQTVHYKKKPIILLVEDNNDLRTFIGSELSESFQVIEARNGIEGLEKAKSSIPELIISDIMMDKMDGIELCNKLKTDEHTSHIPIILLTARHSEDIKLESYEIGADDYITKPFNINLLNIRIFNLIEQRRKLRKQVGSEKEINISSVTNKIDAQFLEKLNRNIEKNIGDTNFDPATLASDMAMSRMQLYRKVTALTNQTVYNYIRSIRLNKAAHLLVTTNMQIAEVALSLGFAEPSNFTKIFTKHFNQTPSQYTRQNRR